MSDWLTLKEAAEMLGVHSSTLRRWSDDGRIATVRTKGGHRRFSRETVEQFLVGQHARSMAEGPKNLSPAWRDSFQGESLDEVRHLGQRLLGLMMQYVTRQNEDERFLAEGRHIGKTYGRETAAANLAMLDMVEAFLYFRSHFTAMTIQLPAFPQAGDDEEMRRLHSRLDRFMNEVLLGAIEGYEAYNGLR